MKTRIALGFMALASLSLAGCAAAEKMGWHTQRAEPSEAVRSNCEALVKTVNGQPDHATALKACIAAETRQGLLDSAPEADASAGG